MNLSTLNFIVCTLGCFLCLWALLTKKADTTHWSRLFFISFAGFAFITWLISGMVNAPFVLLENVIGRGCTVLAVAFAIFEIYQSDKK